MTTTEDDDMTEHEDEWNAYGQELLDAGRPGWKGRQWLLTDALAELADTFREYEPDDDEADYEGRFPTYAEELMALASVLTERTARTLEQGVSRGLAEKLERRRDRLARAHRELAARLTMQAEYDELRADELEEDDDR